MAKIRKLHSGGNKKKGRNKIWCEFYRREKRRERNKIKKIIRHLRYFPGDRQSRKRLNELTIFCN